MDLEDHRVFLAGSKSGGVTIQASIRPLVICSTRLCSFWTCRALYAKDLSSSWVSCRAPPPVAMRVGWRDDESPTVNATAPLRRDAELAPGIGTVELAVADVAGDSRIEPSSPMTRSTLLTRPLDLNVNRAAVCRPDGAADGAVERRP